MAVVETERLTLRPAQPADLPAHRAAFDEVVVAAMGWRPEQVAVLHRRLRPSQVRNLFWNVTLICDRALAAEALGADVAEYHHRLPDGTVVPAARYLRRPAAARQA